MAACSDLPLFAVPSGNIRVWEPEIEGFALAAAALCSPYSFVLLYEARIMRGPLRRQCIQDAPVVLEVEQAGGTSKSNQVGLATRALQANSQMLSIAGNAMGQRCVG